MTAYRHIIILIISVLLSLPSRAETVTTTGAGTLHTLVKDYSAKQLTVTGPIDARDFKFISDNLPHLAELNIEGAEVKAYTVPTDSREFIYSHGANELPSLALMGHASLTKVRLPSSLEAIGYGAFSGCSSLREIVFPASLRSIGADAFSSCSSLTAVAIGGNVGTVGKRAFAHCSNLAKVTVTPLSAMTIEDETFMDCSKLSDVQIGATVERIGTGAFAGCTSLKSISLASGASVASIGELAFYGSTLQSMDFAQMPALRQLEAWSLARTRLKSVKLPSSIKSLGEGVLYYATSLTGVEFDKTLTRLPDYILAGCDKIKNNNLLTAGMESVGDYALYNQSQHRTITIPYRVSRIGTRAMAGMTGLQSIDAEPVQIPELGEEVWAGVNQGKVALNVPRESVNLYRNALQWMDFIIAAPTTRGDVNEDGTVNAGDVSDLQRLIATGDATGLNRDLTDVNGDGHVDVGDIASIINIINSSVPGTDPARYDIDNNLYAEGSLTSGNSAKLEMSLYNTTPFTAFQFFITAPRGVTISQAALSGRCPGHRLLLEKTDETTYLLLAYSPSNQPIDAQDGVILTLDVTSAQPIIGEQKLTATSITFADPQENVYVMPDEQFSLLGTSHVVDVTSDRDNGPVNVYNIQGQLLRSNVSRDTATQGLPAGIYIVGGKKVIVR